VDATERFAELVGRPPDEIPLDQAALVLAQHAHPDLDASGALAQLDELARAVPEASAAAVASTLFQDAGFAGNTVDYEDPRNSYLDDVLARRLGIPISLSVVMIEVGRRRGVAVVGVGMPGHFLVRDLEDETAYFDPFHGGRQLDADGCRSLYEQIFGTQRRFTPEFLAPVDTRNILSRMLANLQNTVGRRDPAALPWVARLRLHVPGLGVDERRRLAGMLRDAGQFGEAAAELERLAAEADGVIAETLQREAAATRARAN
jgi:regulator of sirC expression with transglutaminase-like and TPR domain